MKTVRDIKINIYEQVPPLFMSGDEIAIDLEIFGMQKGKFHRPVGKFASAAVTADGENVYVITSQYDLTSLEESVADATPIFHNAMFDIFHMRRWMQFPDNYTMWDTMLMEQVLWGGYYNGFGLNDLVRRYLDLYMPKDTRTDYQTATKLTDEMIEYNAYDAAMTWRVKQKQAKQVKKSHRRTYFEVDQPNIYTFMNAKGAMIDVPLWLSAHEMFSAKAEELKKGFPFNPNSPAQVKKHFTEVLKIELSGTGAEILERVRDPMAGKILEYRKYAKRVSTYGKKWLEKYLEDDCRVYTHYNVCRAESGRTSSSDPNVQQIPARDVPIYRQAFIAAPGYVLVGGDFGQQEIRCAAYLSQDDDLIALLKSGEDIYAGVATEIHGRKIVKADKERQDAKGVVLGAIYGLTSKGLHAKLKAEWEDRKRKMGAEFTEPEPTEESCQELLDMFFSRYQKLAIWCNTQREKVYTQGYVRTPDGRKCWLNPYHWSVENNALNSPNQGGGAAMIKLAAKKLYQRWSRSREPFPLILQVHDELVLEVMEENKEYAVELLREVMLDAAEEVIPGIPAKVDIKTGQNWSEIH